MNKFLLVALGGAVGSAARYALGGWALRGFGPGWPYGTFAANLIGGGFIGLLTGYLAFKGGGDQERLRLLLQVGVLGGFTTFSAYSLETALMIERKAYGAALGYAVSSAVLAVLAVFAGLFLARKVFA
ncbi:MAG: camphor resistance protein CrcB [Phenylobacterium zucineum]|nr:MAG: camphor resistance protein CrcB [Phenylobacterium zucineum]